MVSKAVALRRAFPGQAEMGDGDGETTMETSWQVGQVVGGAYQVQELLHVHVSAALADWEKLPVT